MAVSVMKILTLGSLFSPISFSFSLTFSPPFSNIKFLPPPPPLRKQKNTSAPLINGACFLELCAWLCRIAQRWSKDLPLTFCYRSVVSFLFLKKGKERRKGKTKLRNSIENKWKKKKKKSQFSSFFRKRFQFSYLGMERV